jgi:hypothetical protein
MRAAVDELANALQGAVVLAALVRAEAQTISENARMLDAAIVRAVAALKRIQPRSDH